MSIETSLIEQADLQDLEGLTIKKIIASPNGSRGSLYCAIMVFTDHSWAGLSIDDESIEVGKYRSSAYQLMDIMSPSELQEAGLINNEQCRMLLQKAAEREENRKKIAVKMQALRAELRELERELM